MPIEKMYSADDLAIILSLNKQTILRFLREGKIKSTKAGREYRIKESDLEAYLA